MQRISYHGRRWPNDGVVFFFFNFYCRSNFHPTTTEIPPPPPDTTIRPIHLHFLFFSLFRQTLIGQNPFRLAEPENPGHGLPLVLFFFFCSLPERQSRFTPGVKTERKKNVLRTEKKTNETRFGEPGVFRPRNGGQGEEESSSKPNANDLPAERSERVEIIGFRFGLGAEAENGRPPAAITSAGHDFA